LKSNPNCIAYPAYEAYPNDRSGFFNNTIKLRIAATPIKKDVVRNAPAWATNFNGSPERAVASIRATV
jgi:hypothetical protein